ncbi:Phosphoglycerate dehydrogenase [Paenibacillus polysaccharolyticus]|uniref:Phosphoglycerate dehydrogenase n=1 Tax=Paenibacillus polysaccharolyticus TaxID=582692 RepID=A0A1G5E2V0_9BACL|nr:D-2-hydroxyacid dehydrogenase family protein [Paenibacillus polysaccharolyticus]SCY21292.1 Phosphoglycerate dehydrogenase [Paenibacillus polysaccharolyticus]
MKLRCAILDDYQNIALKIADWSSVAGRVEVKSFQNHFESEAEAVCELKDFEIIIIMRERTPFKSSLLSKLPRLKLLITTGMRNASIDIKYAEEHGIAVCGTASNSEPPTELTWALILALTKNLIPENQAFRNRGAWQSTVCSDLNGKTLGLLGLGKIGSKMALIGNAFGMKVMAWSQNLTQERAEAVGAHFAATKEEILAQSDIVSIHLVLSERTRHLIGENELKSMKKTAYLINTSRAAIIDEEMLIKALHNNWIAGAGIDVFNIEPLPEFHQLRSIPNLLATPHLGYVSQNNYQIYYQHALEDIKAYIEGNPIRIIKSKK